jgi:hypothetical protein
MIASPEARRRYHGPLARKGVDKLVRNPRGQAHRGVFPVVMMLASCATDHALLPDAGADADAGPSHARTFVVLPPDKLAVLAGSRYTPAPGQEAIGFYGTDLGVSFRHGDETRILFGDTWADATSALVGLESDDVQGVVSGVPDGAAVEASIAARPLSPDAPWWQRAAPPIVFDVSDGRIAPFELLRGGAAGQPVNMGIGRAVIAAFSNGRDGAFAIFRRDVPVACSGGTAPSCDDGFECDQGLGRCRDSFGDYALPCLIGTTRCECLPIPEGGYCQDRTSSMFGSGDEDGRLESVVIQHEVGVADAQRARRYFTRPWVTNKFTNAIAKTVADFDPERSDPAQNDYRPARGTDPAREKVLLWARPHTVGTKVTGRDARLYFAYLDVPEYSASADFAWQPRYFAGMDGGRPTFSSSQRDAIALDIAGVPEAQAEPNDVVDRTAVSYLPSLRTWVMLYGGDFAPPILSLFAGPNWPRVQRHPTGAIHARFAEHPWGPWSAPVPALEAGDSALSPPAAGSEYAPRGMLHHSGCRDLECISGERTPSHADTPYGFLYAPNIFDEWTVAHDADHSVDLYWNVSTWNPYQVVLLRTRIRAN